MNDVDKQMALDRLRFQNVQFLICGNTLLAYPVKRQDLYEVAEEDMVQAGLPTIVALQQAGLYICATVTRLFSAKWRDFWPYTPYN